MPVEVLVVTLHKRYVALEDLAVRACGSEVALALIDEGLKSSVAVSVIVQCGTSCIRCAIRARLTLSYISFDCHANACASARST